ncbi:MAG: DUF3576 domain-containing protein [Rhodobacteraceae bacterium]|nr:DUF3576 domain-containing protein [Paracoccaceae bacterium]
MDLHRFARITLVSGVLMALASCGTDISSNDTPSTTQTDPKTRADAQRTALAQARGKNQPHSTIFNFFKNTNDPNTTIKVNKYLWNASLDVLDFLPIESIDPFTGVIVTGYGTPPGSSQAYRAIIYVQDPALDARSLKVAIQTRGKGAIAPETIRAVEDAILTRARQLRIQDSKL